MQGGLAPYFQVDSSPQYGKDWVNVVATCVARYNLSRVGELLSLMYFAVRDESADREELNLQVDSADALFSCEHAYPDRQVELHFWRVTEYQGEAEGLEGQRLRWVQADDLASLDFLEGNRALLEKVCAMVLPR